MGHAMPAEQPRWGSALRRSAGTRRMTPRGSTTRRSPPRSSAAAPTLLLLLLLGGEHAYIGRLPRSLRQRGALAWLRLARGGTRLQGSDAGYS
mmetsp:Transcript_3797/g.9478  ORF Transcript_3797/g.9478 Transcript_3797/m.9478 type:complete len:93 (+) Transcript_3797:49-327(+)